MWMYYEDFWSTVTPQMCDKSIEIYDVMISQLDMKHSNNSLYECRVDWVKNHFVVVLQNFVYLLNWIIIMLTQSFVSFFTRFPRIFSIAIHHSKMLFLLGVYHRVVWLVPHISSGDKGGNSKYEFFSKATAKHRWLCDIETMQHSMPGDVYSTFNSDSLVLLADDINEK